MNRPFRRKKLEADMAAKMRTHLDAQIERNVAAGMYEACARAAKVEPMVALRAE